MNVLLTALSIFAGLHYVGFGLSGTICRTSPEKAVGFAPLFGLVYLMFRSWWAFRLDLRLGGCGSLAIVLPAIFLSTCPALLLIYRSMRSKETNDLLHVDIQGGKETLFVNNENLLNKKVKLIIIGTHSRIKKGKLFEFFYKLGWNLVAKRALIGELNNGRQKMLLMQCSIIKTKLGCRQRKTKRPF